MLTDEQLLQSQAVRDVLARMGNQGLHKTAGAVALGVDEVTLENAVLALCTKIAAQVLKEQRIASGLASLSKVAMAPAQQTMLDVEVCDAEKTANALTRMFSRGKPAVPHTAPPRLPADAIAPMPGGAMRLTGGADAPIPNKVLLPEWMRGQQAAELPAAQLGMARPSPAAPAAPKTRGKATAAFDPNSLELNSMIAGSAQGAGRPGAQALDPNAFGSPTQQPGMFNVQEMMARGKKTAAILDAIFQVH